MHIAVIDDKPNEITSLLKYLQRHDSVKQISVISELTQLYDNDSVKHFDAAYVDVMMPEITGFELARNFLKDIPVVFISSDPTKAVEAFDFQPIYFLSKPVDTLSILRSLQKIKEKLEHRAIDPILISTGRNQITRLEKSEVLFIKSENEYVSFKTTSSKKYITLGSIKHWAQVLENTSFHQCHRSYIVNLCNIRTLGSEVIILNNKEELPLSQRYKNGLRAAFQGVIKT